LLTCITLVFLEGWYLSYSKASLKYLAFIKNNTLNDLESANY